MASGSSMLPPLLLEAHTSRTLTLPISPPHTHKKYQQVSCTEPYEWKDPTDGEWEFNAAAKEAAGGKQFLVVAYDFGIKHNILRRLASFGCKIMVVPATYPADKVLAMNPDGVFFSNGPVGDALVWMGAGGRLCVWGGGRTCCEGEGRVTGKCFVGAGLGVKRAARSWWYRQPRIRCWLWTLMASFSATARWVPFYS